MSVQVATQIAVRRLTSEDLPALELMYSSYAGLGNTFGVPPRDPDSRRYWLRQLGGGINLVAYVDDAVAGHLVLVPTGGGAAQMMTYVHQSFRRQGVGTALAIAAIEEAYRDGFHFIWLLIAKTNLAAWAWLQKSGFRIVWQDEREMQFLRSTLDA